MSVTIASRAEELFLTRKESQILRQRILFLLLNLYQQGYREFYTNCAYGVPLWSAELVLQMRNYYPDVYLHAILPHNKQADEWEISMKDRYFEVIKSANLIQYISSPSDRHSFEKADEFMIHHSDLLLFYGTQGFISYAPKYQTTGIETLAREKQMPIRYI